MKPLGIKGAALFTPEIHGDDRGAFLEWFRGDELAAVIGHPLGVMQGNCSVSSRGVLRGVHFAEVPPGQAKYVMCVRGAVQDVIVDMRLGSPTFGQWESVRLDENTRHAVYMAEGLGHAFMALTDSATVVYMCSERYNGPKDYAVHPLDPEIGIAWDPEIEPILSPRDQVAPTLAEAEKLGLLPDYQTCLDFYATLAP